MTGEHAKGASKQRIGIVGNKKNREGRTKMHLYGTVMQVGESTLCLNIKASGGYQRDEEKGIECNLSATRTSREDVKT